MIFLEDYTIFNYDDLEDGLLFLFTLLSILLAPFLSCKLAGRRFSCFRGWQEYCIYSSSWLLEICDSAIERKIKPVMILLRIGMR